MREIQFLKDTVAQELSVTISDFHRIEMGVMNFNYSFRANNEEYILRDSIRENIPFEYRMMTMLFEHGCRVPEPVLLFHDIERPWMIYKKIDGQALSTTDNVGDHHHLAIQIMNNINTIADIKGEHFGDGLKDSSQKTKWSDYLMNSIGENLGYLSLVSEFSAGEIDSITRFISDYRISSQNIIPSLIWSDLSQDNIIVKDGNLTGFVDFEGCFFGDPVLSLGYLFALEGHSRFFNDIQKQFEKSYSLTDEMIVFYALLRILRIARYVNQPLPTGAKRYPLKQYFKGIPIALSKINKV